MNDIDADTDRIERAAALLRRHSYPQVAEALEKGIEDNDV